MIYIINDVVTCRLTGNSSKVTVKVCNDDEELKEFITNPGSLNRFKGEVKIEKVIL